MNKIKYICHDIVYLYIDKILHFMLQFHLLYYRNSFYNLIHPYCNNINSILVILSVQVYAPLI